MPDKLTPKNVQYYCSHTQELVHSQIHKAILFVENNSINLLERDAYLSLPNIVTIKRVSAPTILALEY